MFNSFKNNKSGFTIIEMVVGLATGLIILGVAGRMFIIQQEHFNTQINTSEMQQNIRAAMNIIVKETRMAGYNPTGADFDGITYSTSIHRIMADITDDTGDGTSDGDTDDTNEDITYSFDAANLQIDRDTGAGAQSIAENITAFTFSYLDTDGVATDTSSDIRQIQITITGRYSDPDTGYKYGTLTSNITPVNLGF